MKHVVSISLGSSSRNHSVEAEFLGEKFKIERIGTDGDKKKAIQLIEELDGKVDAFGMGGIDLYICIGKKKYLLKDAANIAKAAKKTPIVDGSGLKNTLERKVIEYLNDEYGLKFKDKKVLLVCGMDRFGMAETFEKYKCDLTLGDVIFALGIPIPLKSLKGLNVAATLLAPIVARLPFELIYPTGEKQESSGGKKSKFGRFYRDSDIIAGDFHFIKKHMPERLDGKIIITNTVTPKDVDMLKEKGVNLLITTTPNLNGRSFGTNVMEGVLVTLSGKELNEITAKDYEDLLDKMDFKPRIEVLND
ncbi:MAG TPA: quinate 5-dehydrogenase [Thermoanaerobacterales bacterium]|nr:quinate 5-dehydrogenase [Thermoanaerobacterales bacterium]